MPLFRRYTGAAFLGAVAAAALAWVVARIVQPMCSHRGRRLLQEMNPVDAIEFIIDKMRKTQTNKDFFDLMSQ